MSTKHKNSILFETEAIDSENENNAHRCRRGRRNICSTLESEAELIDENTTDTQCNTTWIHKFSSNIL